MNLPRANEPLQRQSHSVFALTLFLLLALATPAPADIFRWDNGQLIPGTEGVTPGPGLSLFDAHIAYADLRGTNLRNARIFISDLTHADLSTSNCESAQFTHSNLSFANLSSANFNGAYLGEVSDSDLRNTSFVNSILESATFSRALFAGADFSGAMVTRSNFSNTTATGFTKEHLYSTNSHQFKRMQEINLSANNLAGWDFELQDLTGASLAGSTLANARFDGATISGAKFNSTTQRGFSKEQLFSTLSYQQKNLERIDLSDNDLSGWNLSGQNLADANLKNATWTNTNLAGARLDHATLASATSRGFTKEQFYSIANYQQKNLERIDLSGNNLTGWDFRGQYLSQGNFIGSLFANADFSDSDIHSSRFGSVTSRGFTKEQLYSTRSYQQKNLQGVFFGSETSADANDFSGWNFSGQYLSRADFSNAKMLDANLSSAELIYTDLRFASLANADLTGAAFWIAELTGTNFTNSVIRGAGFESCGLTQEQFYSTASYKQKDLHGVGLYSNDLSGWDFSGHDLTNARFGFSKFTNTNLTGAKIAGASFAITTSYGFTKEHLYSTASYQAKQLQGIRLYWNDLREWDFSEQDLTGANLDADLTDANFAGAIIRGVRFFDIEGKGFTKEQLYSTASHQQNDLRGIILGSDRNPGSYDLTGWQFSGQDLTNAVFAHTKLIGANFSRANLTTANLRYSDLSGADLSQVIGTRASFSSAILRGADLRAAVGLEFRNAHVTQNAIRPDGEIRGLDLAATETLVVRDFEMGIRVTQKLQTAADSTLNMIFDDADWGSTITVDSGIAPLLAGALKLDFSAAALPADLIGTTFDLFDWTGVNPTGTFTVVSDYSWDTSRLYTTGEVTLIPEPATLALLLAAATLLALATLLRRRAGTDLL